MNIVLASSSRYRANLLSQLGINALCVAPNIDESPLYDEDPRQLSARLSREKALEVTNNLPELQKPALIIGSDQVASFENQLLGKPHSREKAIEQLSAVSGKQVTFYTGLHMHSSADNGHYSCLDITQVTFRQLTAREISNYVDRELPLDCAGSFKCEGLGISLFESIESKDPSALIGLPLIAVNKALLHFGVNLLSDANFQPSSTE